MNIYPDIVSIIRKNILFLDLEDEILFQIAETLQLQEIAQESVIYKQGDVADGLYLVVSGEVLIFAERDNEEYILSHAPATYLFGEFILQGNSVRSTSAKALVDTRLLFLSRDSCRSFVSHFPEKGAMIGARIVNRLCWNQTTLALRLSHLFVGLDEDIVRALINQMELQSIPSNTLLIGQDTISHELWIIVDGQFQLNQITIKRKDGHLTCFYRTQIIFIYLTFYFKA